MKKLWAFLIFLSSFSAANAQIKDSSIIINLQSVEISGVKILQDIQQLEPIQGTYIYAGKKNEVIDITQKGLAIAEKYGRQVFAKVPGVFVYDMDGTGNQVNISARGLDPHRGWEFNIRKDGIMTNSDIYGYPASHYNVPLEAVEKIEIVRGTGSLQYGAQFGGMINYVTKEPEKNKKIAFESIQSVGSFGLFSSFIRMSGAHGKWRYQAWANQKRAEGYRDNNQSRYNAEAITLWYEPTERLKFKVEWTHSNYRIQLAGPLTQEMFEQNPRMATRSRNFYSPSIHVPSFTGEWAISTNTKLKINASAIRGSRNSVLFDRPATVRDSIVAATLQYNHRQVDIDNFNSFSSEARFIHSYTFLKQRSTYSAGVQFINNDLHRRQLGKGTTGSDYDLELVTPVWGRDLNLKSKNIAFFVENRWLLTSKWSVTGGVRIENGASDLSGVMTYYPVESVPNTIQHSFALFAGGTQYDFSPNINIYAGWSQAYRPVIFKDIIPASVYESSDKNLKNAFGHNAELGFRGKWKSLKWDITGFLLQYNNRLGILAQEKDPNGNLLLLRTNIGNSNTKGLEFFIQKDIQISDRSYVSIFTASAYMNAQYQDATIRSGSENISLNGKKVESTPNWISRNGLTYKYKEQSISILYSYTAESFADPLNTILPSPSGSVGLVPAYGLLDANLTISLHKQVKVQLNLNNLLDKQYFTKRPQFYPGPGIWPSDGRSVSASVSIQI